jgi:hypothetical protein
LGSKCDIAAVLQAVLFQSRTRRSAFPAGLLGMVLGRCKFVMRANEMGKLVGSLEVFGCGYGVAFKKGLSSRAFHRWNSL